MKNSTLSLQLDLDGTLMPPTVNVQKGDNKKTLKISLWNGLRRYQLAPDIWPVLSAKKPDGNILYNVCEIEGNEIIYHFTEQTSNCLGLMKAELKLYGGSQQLITTMYFFIAVHKTIFQAEDAAKSKDEQTALDALVNRTQQQSLILDQKLKNGDFKGKSAYEIAVQLGYAGTENEWIQSLRYDHSEEFTALSQQAVEASTAAQQSARDATRAAEAAGQSAGEAQGSASEAAGAAGEAGTQAQLAAASAENSAQAEEKASADAAEAKKQADASLQSAGEARNEADRASVILENTVTKQEAGNALCKTVLGRSIVLNDVSPIEHICKCRCIINMLNPGTWSHSGILSEDGNSITSDKYLWSDYISVVIDETYSFNCNHTEASVGNIVFMYSIIEYDINKHFLRRCLNFQGLSTGTYVPSLDAAYIVLVLTSEQNTALSSENVPKCIQFNNTCHLVPYTSYVSDLTSIKISQYGLNLFDSAKQFSMQYVDYDPSTDIYSCYDNDSRDLTLKIQLINKGNTIRKTIYANNVGTGKCTFPFTKVNDDHTIRIANAGKNSEFSIYYPVSNIPDNTNLYITLFLIDITPGHCKFKDLQLTMSPHTYRRFSKPSEHHPSLPSLNCILESNFPGSTIFCNNPDVYLEVNYNRDNNQVITDLEKRIIALENKVI